MLQGTENIQTVVWWVSWAPGWFNKAVDIYCLFFFPFYQVWSIKHWIWQPKLFNITLKIIVLFWGFACWVSSECWQCLTDQGATLQWSKLMLVLHLNWGTQKSKFTDTLMFRPLHGSHAKMQDPTFPIIQLIASSSTLLACPHLYVDFQLYISRELEY